MSIIIEYLNQLATMQGLNEKQLDFFKWRAEQAKDIYVVSTIYIMERYPEIKSFLSVYKPKIKQCFANASGLAIEIQEVKYVEGFTTTCGIAIDHAWNQIDGLHFDITADLVLAKRFGKKYGKGEYASIITLNAEQVYKHASKSGFWGGLIPFEYQSHRKMSGNLVDSE